MIIRNYKPGDFPQIEALWRETGIYTMERGDTPEIILRCNTQGGKFLIMEDDLNSRIIGTSWLTWDGRRVLMHHFAVLPSLQGRGYGRKLALESLAFAREKRSPLKLEVHRDNTPAIQLYRSLGFDVFEDYDVYMIHNDS
ncbi:MAG: GNAT family N-acetyltransferase [Bacteroidales bacterium]|nr:GNAT family N-acetyltransferase [Bacteroidales bacterium]